MFHLKQVLPTEFLRQLAESTARGIARRDCFYDQFHYVNRGFVMQHFEQLAGLIVNALSEVHSGITIDDLTYVNDFVSPVNLANGQIHVLSTDNRYGWHKDGIDYVFRPCYNLWIPLYRRSALSELNSQSLLDVLTPAACPPLYDADGTLKGFWNIADPEIASELVGMPTVDAMEYMYFHNGRKIDRISMSELTPASVVRPLMGDCYVFNSGNLHASGPSKFERIGISIKFLVNNPKFGFRVMPHISAAEGWWGMFVCWYDQYGTFSAYQRVLDKYISREQSLLERNADKLESVREVLLQIRDELAVRGQAIRAG